MLLVFCYLSEIINSRCGAAVILQFWALPLLIALYRFTEQTSQWSYYAVVTILVGYPYVHPVQVAWASTNSYSVGTRTVSASIYNMFVQADGIIGVCYTTPSSLLGADRPSRLTSTGPMMR